MSDISLSVNNKNLNPCEHKLSEITRLLDAERCNEQVCRSVALNRLEVTYDLLIKAADAGGLSAVQLQSVLLSIEHSMLVVESSGRERPVVVW